MEDGVAIYAEMLPLESGHQYLYLSQNYGVNTVRTVRGASTSVVVFTLTRDDTKTDRHKAFAIACQMACMNVWLNS